MRIYDADATRLDGGPAFPADQQVIERLERSAGVFDYDERLIVRVGRADGRYAYAAVEAESVADTAATLRNWRDAAVDVTRFVEPLDTGPSDAETELDALEEANSVDTDESNTTVDTTTDTADTATDTADTHHPVPTRVRVFNGDTGTCHFDNDAEPSPPAWSDETSARADYRRNLRLFADPEAGTFRCYLNVRRNGPEQVIADVSVDRAPPEPFLAYCARAVTRAIRSRDWTLYDTDEQLVFDVLRGETAVDPVWPYDDRETALLRDAVPLSVVTPTQRGAMGVVDTVRGWADGSSLSVAGGDRDGPTGDAATRIRYTPRVSAVTVTGEGDRRLALARRDRARETVDETLAALADAVEGDRLPNVRAAAWLNDTLGGTAGENALGREEASDRGSSPSGDDTGQDTSPPGRVRPSDRRLLTQLRRLLPTAAACLTLVAVTVLITLFGRPAAAVAVLGREVVSVGLATVISGSAPSVPVWQLLVATLLPPVATIWVFASPRGRLRRQVAAVRDVTRWLARRREPPETAVDAAGTEFAAAVATAGRSTDHATGDHETADAETFLEGRLAASPLQLTTRLTPEPVVPPRTAAAALAGVTVTLSLFATPAAGALGRADAVVSFLPSAAAVSLPVSWLAAVVAVWRS